MWMEQRTHCLSPADSSIAEWFPHVTDGIYTMVSSGKDTLMNSIHKRSDPVPDTDWHENTLFSLRAT